MVHFELHLYFPGGGWGWVVIIKLKANLSPNWTGLGLELSLAIMMFILATNLVASRPLKRRPTGTLHARANFSCAMCTLSYKMSIQTIVSPHFLIFRSSDPQIILFLFFCTIHSLTDRKVVSVSVQQFTRYCVTHLFEHWVLGR